MTDQGYAGSLSLHLLDMCWLGIGFEVLTGLCLPPISVRMLWSMVFRCGFLPFFIILMVFFLFACSSLLTVPQRWFRLRWCVLSGLFSYLSSFIASPSAFVYGVRLFGCLVCVLLVPFQLLAWSSILSRSRAGLFRFDSCIVRAFSTFCINRFVLLWLCFLELFCLPNDYNIIVLSCL